MDRDPRAQALIDIVSHDASAAAARLEARLAKIEADIVDLRDRVT